MVVFLFFFHMQPGQITINSSGLKDHEINPGILGKTAHLLSFLMGALALSPKKVFPAANLVAAEESLWGGDCGSKQPLNVCAIL